jgi:hypothetical protein
MGDALPYVKLPTGEVLRDLYGNAAGGTVCATFESGGLRCWGSDGRVCLCGDCRSGLLGRGAAGDLSSPPATPIDLGGVAVRSVGFYRTNAVCVATQVLEHACAILEDDRVLCWGWGIGDDPGEMGASLTPEPIHVLLKPRKMAPLFDGTCYLFDNGRIGCSTRTTPQICAMPVSELTQRPEYVPVP